MAVEERKSERVLVISRFFSSAELSRKGHFQGSASQFRGPYRTLVTIVLVSRPWQIVYIYGFLEVRILLSDPITHALVELYFARSVLRFSIQSRFLQSTVSHHCEALRKQSFRQSSSSPSWHYKDDLSMTSLAVEGPVFQWYMIFGHARYSVAVPCDLPEIRHEGGPVQPEFVVFSVITAFNEPGLLS